MFVFKVVTTVFLGIWVLLAGWAALQNKGRFSTSSLVTYIALEAVFLMSVLAIWGK